MKVKVAQSCSTLCDPVDYTVHGILQAGILEWVFPSPGDLPNPWIESRSPTLQVDSLPAEPPANLYQLLTKKFFMLAQNKIACKTEKGREKEIKEGNKECKGTKYVREYDRELEIGEPGP